nr:transposase [Micromonospora sp. U21]
MGQRRLQEQGHRTRRHPRHRRRGRRQRPAHQRISVVKRRWVIERTLGWIMLHRRLARDYNALPDNPASMIHIAMIDNLTKRVTDETTPTWRDI